MPRAPTKGVVNQRREEEISKRDTTSIQTRGSLSEENWKVFGSTESAAFGLCMK